MRYNKLLIILLIAAFYSCNNGSIKETFPALSGGIAPTNVDNLWSGFDPRKEPLDTEILHQWEQEGVVLQVLRYRAGIFKGHKAMVAAIFGYPVGGEKLPGLVQIHGGGQYADYRAVLTNAKRGYATISVSWAGRINAPDYIVSPKEVKLFWENDTMNPAYKLTTDWGAVDGYHAPSRNPDNDFFSLAPNPWTLDTIDSPRNNSWFLAAVAARRALTFLEKQPQVNADKLGVYGHSMGGKLTTMTAADPRVKAAAPSCGGISGNGTDNDLYRNTLADSVYLKKIKCPIIFLSPSNDFHGNLRDIPSALKLIKTDTWRVVSSPHLNHQDHGDHEVTGLLWFDQFLKKKFTYPKTADVQLKLNTKNGIPEIRITPDLSKPIVEVEIFYTQQGVYEGNKTEREHRISRFWQFSRPVNKAGIWIAQLPLSTTDKSLWVYANVKYKTDKPVTGAGYYYRIYTVENFNLSTPVKRVSADKLKEAGVKPVLKPSLIIEDFDKDWEKDWFAYKPKKWELATHKIYNTLWKAPENAVLEFEIFSEMPNVLVVSSNSYATEIKLKGESWQKIRIPAQNLKNALGISLSDWSDAMELKFSANGSFRENAEGQTQKMELGAEWKGSKPEFKVLHWIN